MERVLALQKLTTGALDDQAEPVGTSSQSTGGCSSASTNGCSSQSSNCGGTTNW